MIEIDGSYGEGGGQILRTSLALSAVLKRPILVHHIRAGRKHPGLQAQHLSAVRAIAEITRAQVEGAEFHSEKIRFIPQRVTPADYRVEVETAGSISLVLQALLLPLCLSQRKSRLTLVGGTHVDWSPPFHYLTDVLFPALEDMGAKVQGQIEQWGWYPKGGGVAHVEIEPASDLKPISLIGRGKLNKIKGISVSSNLPEHVTERQRDYALKKIREELKVDAEIEILHNPPSRGTGSFLFLKPEFERSVAGFSSFGRKGKPAEKVADEAYHSLREFVSSDGCVDPHLADQLVPFMALIRGRSSFTTTQITEHLLTNLWVIRHFLDITVLMEGVKGGPGRIEMISSPVCEG
ncbi:MAG: RNA 3'-terminal-phosphate cyclase [Deltaproteobacteria bacterium RBG_16_49_23]|nr:MAG: RNA 3'-terminal-phosphate cyclase [Deltaproteobacteria bacterium RBG_16_49_23]